MNIKNITLVVSVAAVVVLGVMLMTAQGNKEGLILRSVIGVSAQCQDGMWSTAKRNKGTCSGHGGVKKWLIR